MKFQMKRLGYCNSIINNNQLEAILYTAPVAQLTKTSRIIQQQTLTLTPGEEPISVSLFLGGKTQNYPYLESPAPLSSKQWCIFSTNKTFGSPTSLLLTPLVLLKSQAICEQKNLITVKTCNRIKTIDSLL